MPRIRLAGLLALLPLFAQADVIVGSWNIKHLGWNNDKAMPQVAHVANHFDLLAVQELMDPAALEALEGELEALSGEAWSSMASHALGRSAYEEHFGFLWREREVAYEDGAVVFIGHGDVFAREPYSARFRDVESGEVFTLATVHVVYGDSVGDRLPEIAALADYWQWLGEVHPQTPRLLAGDFNLPPEQPAWRALRERGATGPRSPRGARPWRPQRASTPASTTISGTTPGGWPPMARVSCAFPSCCPWPTRRRATGSRIMRRSTWR
ncbi:endonuclease/exonuclease/phosphatase family protein [Halomonas ventosae]|uniref:Endonuclease/exonuclease/phosphatase family metal-dependent hydrolase n=1 Tax=Halomonas ventosae TaxID=229007 RepID=A0A2T0VR56_9GAMM|nr:endonuclease/exonuclease/phosphatase family protein [Halomonas ventosae]PRY72991.1 endonuclease/exonuclease/phosphatase family metal-dependent hydrolase [Halomonas ventosae]